MNHSEKGLKTLAEMGTAPESWGLTPIKWENKLVKINAWVACPDCGGGGYKKKADESSWKPSEQEACDKCPRVPFTKKGRTYFWKHSEENFYRRNDGHHGAVWISRYAYMNGLVQKEILVEKMVGKVLWAEGTEFDSRFSQTFDQCHLCAKVIPSHRFVPVNGKGANEVIHGMWVGEDCARKFFGIKAFTPEQIISREAN